MNAEFIEALRQIEREKEIPFAILLEALETALATAYKRSYNTDLEVVMRVEQGGVAGGGSHATPTAAQMSNNNAALTAAGTGIGAGAKGGFKVYRRMTVVDAVHNEHAEITLPDARAKYNPQASVGDTVEEALSQKDFERIGRIAAQTAKQVVVQRIREAERNKIFEEYNDKIGEIITGTVSRREGGAVIIALGKLEARLPIKEQVPTERYQFNDRIKVFVFDVRNGVKGPEVIVSRTHPSLIRRLFELEVPEIHDNIVSIKSVAREPGQRSKIAVASRDDRVDAVGACVGHRGARVQAVVNELYDEKIDIVRWSAENRQFITESLSPAKVTSVQLDDDAKSAFVVVPDSQLSLAIGKAGQNVRLAARLTGWRIDIRSDSQVARQVFTEAATALEAAPEDVDDESLLPPITFGDELLPPITFGDALPEENDVAAAATDGVDGGATSEATEDGTEAIAALVDGAVSGDDAEAATASASAAPEAAA